MRLRNILLPLLLIGCAGPKTPIDVRDTCTAIVLEAARLRALRECPIDDPETEAVEGVPWEECSKAPQLETELSIALEVCDNAYMG